MDQYTRRIIGFGVNAGAVNAEALCRMFKQTIRGARLPKYLSSDHDPLYRFHQWEANLRILGVTEIKTVPYTPWSCSYFCNGKTRILARTDRNGSHWEFATHRSNDTAFRRIAELQ